MFVTPSAASYEDRHAPDAAELAEEPPLWMIDRSRRVEVDAGDVAKLIAIAPRAGCIDPNGDNRKSNSREAILKLEDPARAGPFSRLAVNAAREYLQATRRYGAGMKITPRHPHLSRSAEPAAACRRFSIWRYNFPQPPCPIASPEPKPRLRRPRPDIPCPT